MTSFWIEFDDWSEGVRAERIPAFPRSSGVTAVDLEEALALIHRGFYENDRELPSVSRVTEGVTVARGVWAGQGDVPSASGRHGIWYPRPLFPERTVVDDGPELTPYPEIARAAIARSEVPARLADGPAVVLELIAYGAGQTNWFLVQHPRDVDSLTERLARGSVIEFIFDGWVMDAVIDEASGAAILAIVAKDGEAFVGYRTGELELKITIVTGPAALNELRSELPSDGRILFGPYPFREEDESASIAIHMPDRDGIVRRHPY